MQDDEGILLNACLDLVTSKRADPFPLRLLANKRPGEWIRVREFCLHIGVAPGDVPPTIFASWLPDPLAHEAYAVIIFYDDESKWSTAAQYNRARLQQSAAPEHLPQPTGSAG